MCKLLFYVITNFIIIHITCAFRDEKKCGQDELLSRCSTALPVLSSPDISFALTRDELDKSCLGLQAGIRCINNYTETCMTPRERITFKQMYAGITGVVNELCTRGEYQDEYLKHASCVKNVRPEYEMCSSTYEVTLTSLNTQHQRNEHYATNHGERTHEDYLRTVCCSFQDYLECSEKTVKQSCGEEAAQFTSAFLKRMASNIIKNFCLEYRGLECGPINSVSSVTPGDMLAPLIFLVSLYHITDFTWFLNLG